MGATEERRDSDVVLVHGVDERRNELHVLRSRDDAVEAGIVRPAEPGKPVHGDLVKLKPRQEFPLLCDVEVIVPDPERKPRRAPPLDHAGPPRVSSEAYRQGWEAVFGRKPAPDDPDAN